ncbi:MAG TPA: hypothetical protein VEU30_16960 [Thermoanaerobaculia bacterium]|nr:hypothetical protein [Thermoanaerobaculia bacterium]
MKRFTTIADVLANLVIIVLGVVVIVLLYQRFTAKEEPHTHAQPANAGRPTPAAPVVGQNVDVGLRFVVAPHLVVAMSSRCAFCDESVPELKALLPKLGETTVVFAFPQRDEPQPYLEKSGLSQAHVWSGDFRSIGVRGTPTVLLVDGQRRLVSFWEGRLTPARSQEIVARLDALR